MRGGMTMTTFYFIRHGKTDFTKANSKIYRGQGFNMLTLSAEGIQQIVETAKSPELKNAKLIVTSPYGKPCFTGSHPLLTQAYSPMTIRFFILQAHYRGTVDFSNEALQGAEKALHRMLDAYRRLRDLKPDTDTPVHDVAAIERQCYEALDDDFNTPMVIAALFDACRIINLIKDGKEHASQTDIDALRNLMDTFMIEILGIRPEGVTAENAGDSATAAKPFEDAVDLLLEIRSEAKRNKDWTTSDLIRNRLSEIGFDVKDTKDGWEWSLKK